MSRRTDVNTISDWRKRMAAQPIWDTFSNELFPTNLQDALYWGNYLRTHNGDVVSAIKRGVSYWLNGIELSGEADDLDNRDYHTELLEKDHKLLQQVLAVGLDLQFYGNSFTTAVRATTRVLRCPKCASTRYLRTLRRGYDYDYKGGKFVSTCSCHHHGEFKVEDFIDNTDTRQLKVITWDPLAITIDFCAITGAEKIIYTPTAEDSSFVDNEAESVALETLPNILLDVIESKQALSFQPGSCLHLASATDSLSVNDMKGWGSPTWLPAFKYVMMLMLLERQTEAAVKDFILPIRLLFPDPAAARGGSDPMAMATSVMHMSNFRSQVEGALRSQANRQSSWQLLPAPVQQLTLGGDGKAIIPAELQQFIKDQILDSLCIPVEFSRSSILVGSNAPPISLRMFEQTWEREVNSYDDYINWYLDRCRQLLGWPAYVGSVMRQSISTDPNRMQLMMSLMDSGVLSQTTILRGLNINPKQERSRLIADEINKATLHKQIENRLQAEGLLSDIRAQQMNQMMQTAMEGGEVQAAPGDGGMGVMLTTPAPGMSTGDPIMDIQNLKSVVTPQNASPDQMQADAQVVAGILMSTPIGSQRNQIYSMVKGLNPTLYAIAKSALQHMEQQARQQGVEQARQGGM